ncbi:CdaR family protein [Parasporobacterium paucivorans]|uniref:YbbR domain-containing protein n=1 Tax=Parasporobacterium paucivorans DSM 15970 TaxID=1122934 RepID=A0A1M6JSN2_9FIRM|nr:CdaR family protein [Parasporobacterium paucivorans]SHJ49737.1 YbbR domain-containing protein [Parasporobacterium paucivorans DSM 15970]
MRKLLTNNIGIKLLSIVFAVILWLVVVNIDDPSVTKTITGIPITILNEDSITAHDYVYTVTSGETATVRVKGPRSILDNLDKTDFTATADFSEMSITNSVYATVELTDENAKYSSKIEFLRNSSVMSIQLESIQTKEMNVTVTYSGNPEEGFAVGTQELSVPSVVVSAPESILKTISSVEINIDTTGKNAEFTTYEEPVLKTADGVTIDYSDNVTISSSRISAKVIMHRIKEVPLVFQTVGTPAEGYAFLELDYEPTSVSVHGLQESLDGLASLVISGTPINIEGARENVTVQIDISQYLPAGVMLQDENQKMINVTAVIQGPVSQIFTLDPSAITLQNTPAGYTAKITTSSIQASLQGTATTLDQLSKSGLTGYLDLSAAKAGANEVNLKLNLPAGVTMEKAVDITVELTQGG